MKSFPFTPTLDYLAIVPFEEDDYIQSGDVKIYIPQNSKRPLNQGQVISKGPNCLDTISIGDVVIWPLHQEDRVTVGRDMFYMVREEFIMCHTTMENLAEIAKLQDKKN